MRAPAIVRWGLILLFSVLSVSLFGSAINSTFVTIDSGTSFSLLSVSGMAPTQEVSWKYNPQDPSNSTGLVGRWKFDEGLGQIAYDASGHGHDATLGNDTVARENDPSWTDGKFGDALSFDGVDDYVVRDEGINLDGSNEATLEVWWKAESFPGGYKWIVGRQFSYGLLVCAGSVDFPIATENNAYADHSFSVNLETGNWYHIAGVYGSKLEVYINGDSIGTVAGISGNIISNSSRPETFVSGNPVDGEANGLNGIIDEVRIYNRALSGEEITENYLKLQNTKTTYNRYWAESGSNSTYRWDFNKTNSPAKHIYTMVSCTFPKGHQILNVTYPAGRNWNATLSSDNYTVSSHNSTHQSLTISEASIHQYGYSYRLYTTVLNVISDVRLEVPLLSSPCRYFAPSKEVRVAIRTEDPYGNASNSTISGFLFNEGKDVLNKTDGTSSSRWLNYSLTLPSQVGKYWFRANCSGNYAGIMVVQIHVSKIKVSFNVDNPRVSVSKVATISGTAKYTVDNSSVPSGKVTVNGTEYNIASGSFSFTDVKSTVGKWAYKVDSVTDGRGCDAIESNTLVYIIWDKIKIVEGGVTDNSTDVGQTVKVWFRAVYEYDGELFDDAKGRLCVGGSDWWVAMDWSPADNRWEYQYACLFPGTETFEVVRVFDDKYGITTINDQADPQSINCNQPSITTVGKITLVCGILAAVAMLLIVVKRKRAHKIIFTGENNVLQT